MDEINETQQDTLQDTGLSSEGEGESTSKEKPKTYTEDQVTKRVNDALSEKGRTDKHLSTREAAIKAKEAEIEQHAQEVSEWRRRKDEEELSNALANPDKLNEYQHRKDREQKEADIAKRERELAKREREYQAEREATQALMRETRIATLAAKYGLDPKVLDKSYLKTAEDIEDHAKTLSKLVPKVKKEAEEEKESFVPDSGVTKGRIGEPTREQLEKMSMEEYAEWANKRFNPKPKP